jgi:hypothetical protein
MRALTQTKWGRIQLALVPILLGVLALNLFVFDRFQDRSLVESLLGNMIWPALTVQVMLGLMVRDMVDRRVRIAFAVSLVATLMLSATSIAYEQDLGIADAADKLFLPLFGVMVAAIAWAPVGFSKRHR